MILATPSVRNRDEDGPARILSTSLRQDPRRLGACCDKFTDADGQLRRGAATGRARHPVAGRPPGRQRQRLVQRLVLKGQPRYVLSRDGERVARLLFAPVEQVRLTVVPRQLNDPRPLVHGVNALVLSGPHTAYVSFRPDGQVTYEEEAWRGVSSLPRLLRHLDP